MLFFHKPTTLFRLRFRMHAASSTLQTYASTCAHLE